MTSGRVIKRIVDRLVEKIFWRVLTSLFDKVLERDAHNIWRALQRRALEETADFVLKEMGSARTYADRFALIEHALKLAPETGLVAEFGVWKGASINFIAASCTGRTVYGFDSFEGLPEDWVGRYSRGTFALRNLPKVRDNVRLVTGWYVETLPAFVETNQEKISFMHIDCDLYSSTKMVFDTFGDRLLDGSVIVFDEFFNYPGWASGGEFRAFMEFLEATGIRAEYIAYCQTAPPVAVRLRLSAASAASAEEARSAGNP